MEDKHTGQEAASASSDVLRDGRTGGNSKTSAGSALSQADQHSDKTTSDQAAEAASDVLRNDSTGDKSKTAAGSALSQKEAGGQ
jgi:hypothetical protein